VLDLLVTCRLDDHRSLGGSTGDRETRRHRVLSISRGVRRMGSDAHGNQLRDRTEEERMGLGVSIVIAAVGAVLVWGVDASVAGLDLDTIGVILLIVGIVGALLSLMYWSTWGGFGGRDDTVVERRGPPPAGR
jgi:hypothetical protein